MLTLTVTSLKPGSSVAVDYPNASTSGTFIAIFTGLTQMFAPITGGQFTIPDGLMGTTYSVVTNGSASDDVILAGPAILEFDFNSVGTLVE